MLNPVENRVKVYTSNPSIIERPKPARKPRPATIIDELAPEPEYQLSEVEKANARELVRGLSKFDLVKMCGIYDRKKDPKSKAYSKYWRSHEFVSQYVNNGVNSIILF
ncbi:hypothetical protein IJK16_01380 [Candidatus Saccharibacteria bacterium]|nr:hypothetical protein [Candidatus Saccharibacteria bacterium]